MKRLLLVGLLGMGIGTGMVWGETEQTTPPFSGTIFVVPNIIVETDPTALESIEPAGQGMRRMFDRRVNGRVEVEAFLFDARFDDGLRSEVQVNPEFGDVETAFAVAEKYATALGRIPTELRRDVRTITIHQGVRPFGGGGNNVLIHTGQGDRYIASGILEETLIHEAAHTSLDRTHARSEGWLAAQEADGRFISTYARSHPFREDIAESYLLHFALRYRRDRIPDSLANTIEETIPHRLKYFDEQNFAMHPIVPGAAVSTETESRIVEDGGTGNHKAIMASDGSIPTHTIFRPQDLSVFGRNAKLPIIAWGNGACANSPWEHVNFLSEVASHGFLVIAIGPMPAPGQRGAEGGPTRSSALIDAIDWAIARNSDPTSPYYGKLDTNSIAVSGMSCGGLQALEVATDPRVTTVMVCNSGILSSPGSGRSGMPGLTKDHLDKLHTPVIYILGGESDIAYNNGMDDVRRINHVPVFAANLDVGHGGTYGEPHGGEYAIVATAWFQWQLKGDNEAAKMFVGDPGGLAQMEGWTVEKKNIP